MIWIDRSKEETAYINNSDDREFEAALLTVGPYIMLREDYAFTEGQNRIDEQLNSFLDKYISDELRWIIPTKCENERIIVFRKLGGRTKNIVEKLFRDYQSQCDLVTIIMAGQEQTHKTIFETNKRLHQYMIGAMGVEESRLMDEEEAKSVMENGVHYLKTVRKEVLKVRVSEHVMELIMKILKSRGRTKKLFFENTENFAFFSVLRGNQQQLYV